MTKTNDSTTDTARRLAAYRGRLKAENLARVEIVLPEKVCDVIQNIAAKEGAKYLETVGALAQLGLETYSQSQAAVGLAQSTNSATDFPSLQRQGACTNTASPAAMNAINTESIGALRALADPCGQKSLSPLVKFFKARKES